VKGRATHSILRWFRAARIALALALLVLGAARPARAQSKSEPSELVPISISATYSQDWEDNEGNISILRGRCRIVQGSTVLESRQMVIWRGTQSAGRGKNDQLTVYLEEDVRIEEPGSTINGSPTMVRLGTRAGVTVNVGNRAKQPGRDDALFVRAENWRRRSAPRIIRTSQLTESGEQGPELRYQQFQPLPGRGRRILLRSRYGEQFSIVSKRAPDRTPSEQVTTITGGVTILIEGLDQRFQGKPIGTVELSADRMVIWSRGEIVGGGEGVVQSQDEPFEVYMEGNIVILQGDPMNPQLKREVHASVATFDVRENKALMLDAELKAYIPSLQGNVRVLGQRIRQIGENNFHAQNAVLTTSPYGKPGFRLQATDVFLDQRLRAATFGSAAPPIDPATGEPEEEMQNWVTSLNNVFFIEDVPVFYLPYLSAPADKSEMPLQNVIFGQDSIFGTQIRTQWDLVKILGLTPQKGQTWSLLADYLSRRGPAVGVTGKYNGKDLFGVPGTYKGEVIGYYIHDQGTDNLGADRRSLIPPDENRGRFEWRHQETLPDGFTVNAELGYLSDRNFLEQYYQWEFDRGKDVETLLYLKQQQGDWAWSALMSPAVNPFEYTTQWLPKGDLYGLSEPLLNGLVTWTSHTSGGYAELHQASPPTDPNDLFTPIPYFPAANGAVLTTRHEFDAPFNLGPVHFIPYFMGEASYWGEGFDGSPISRLAMATGMRSSMDMWRAYPTVQSDVFNLNGLAHRMTLEASYRLTETNRDLSTIPQFNEFDDNAQERFRERMVVDTWGGVLPPWFDPRFYAVRTGAADSVMAPYYELINDQQVFRLALRQKLQTKTGPPDHQRIRDWMTLDLEASFFPNPTRDDFGSAWGLLMARYAWNLSPRTSILANATYDFFTNAEQIWNVGVMSQRSERGSVYLGLVQIRGGGVPGVVGEQSLSSDIVTGSYSYQMSSKWISTVGAAYDLGEHRNAGESFTITRVGLDFLIHVGGNYDVSTGNVGFAVSIEPRIGSMSNGTATQLSNLLNGQRTH